MFFARFNFTLAYQPRIKNGKPDALSCMYSPVDSLEAPETSMLSSALVTTAQLNVEQSVLSAQNQQPGPSNILQGKLLVPENLRSQVLFWAHS